MIKTALSALALAWLAACGGDASSDADAYPTAVQQASDKQAEAIALAPASPCNAVQQCANLAFVEPNGHCSSMAYHAYSLASPTADAASAAAADERTLAQHAVDIAPGPAQACVASIVLPPNLACVTNTCQAALLKP